MTQFHQIVRPAPDRSFLLDLGLAATALSAWFVLQGLQVIVAAAGEELRLVVRTTGWRPEWPFGPWIIGVLALLTAWLRQRFSAGSLYLQERLQRVTLFAVGLMVLTIAALVDPLTYIFPFLTLLWSPYALWALSLVFLAYVHWPTASAASAPRCDLAIAGILLAVCLPAYLFYTLYFCQITMIHGDEGQYLRVTQSLLHDGDMDLANNLDAEQTNEFHVIGFAVHKAPASPEGKVHSVHPIGLSIALLPAYAWGLEHWANPRLASALFMAMLAALCVPLTFVWLSRLGAERWAALLAVAIMASTGPFFYFTNQLFPEIPALLIGLIALVSLSHWQIPDGGYRPWGAWEVPALAVLTLLLSCLPFFHARYAPIGLFCGAGVLLQAWCSPRRYLAIAIVSAVVALGIYALISFHYAFSNDWMGPFRPGNAWAEGALDIATWPLSLPGHWLHINKGILNSSPIYFFALCGLVTLARLRDRRILVCVGFYGATAATNGLHPDWGFGFCYPARFLMTALPVLALGLAIALPLLLRTATTAFFAALALVISLESVFNTLVLTETGYDGKNLLGRGINDFYPLHQHFFAPGQSTMPLLDLIFWALLAAALFLHRVHFRSEQSRQRLGIVALTALMPFLWSRSDTYAARLPLQSLSPYMARLAPGAPNDDPAPLQFEVPLRIFNADAKQSDGSLLARPGITSPSLVNSSLMAIPLLRIPHPGLYELRFPGMTVSPTEGQVSGHLTISHGYTVQAVSFWADRTSFPLQGGQIDENYRILFPVDQPSIHYIYGEYSGYGTLQIQKIYATFVPTTIKRRIEEIHRVSHEEVNSTGIKAAAHLPNLPPGHYQVHFDISGSTFGTFFERLPTPIKTAVYTGSGAPDQLQTTVYQWFGMERYKWTTVNSPNYIRPLQEGVHPPWWLSIPGAENQARKLRFVIERSQEVWLLLHYDGPHDLELTDIILYREHFDGY